MFTEWLNIINKMTKQHNRIFFMKADNCPPGPKVENLSNMTVKFLQPKASLDLQLPNQGITKKVRHCTGSSY
jgi:hypothetical protein